MLSITGNVRIATDIDVKMISQDMQVTSFVAVSNRYDKRAEGSKASDFITVKLWGKRGVAVAEHFKKGDGIVITGGLQVEQWDDKEGQRQRKAVIVANDWEFPLSKPSSQGDASATQEKPQQNLGGDSPF